MNKTLVLAFLHLLPLIIPQLCTAVFVEHWHLGKEEIHNNSAPSRKGSRRWYSCTVPFWSDTLVGSPRDPDSYIWCLENGSYSAGTDFYNPHWFHDTNNYMVFPWHSVLLLSGFHKTRFLLLFPTQHIPAIANWSTLRFAMVMLECLMPIPFD